MENIIKVDKEAKWEQNFVSLEWILIKTVWNESSFVRTSKWFVIMFEFF